MSKGHEQTFFHRRYTGGQDAHEEMFNITNHQENANQNDDKISPHTSQNYYYLKDKKIISVGEEVEKKEPSFTVGRNINWYSHYETVCWFLEKLKIELPCDPAIPLLGVLI